MIQEFHSWEYINEKKKTIQKDTYTSMFRVALFLQ